MLTVFVFFALLFGGLPIFGAVLVAALVFMCVNDLSILFDAVPIQLYGALEINSLLAIPLFMLVGEVMNKGGLTGRLLDVAGLLVGRFRGGMAYTNLLTNALAASILGSGVAQIGVMSKLMIPAMEKDGYDRAFAGGLTVSAGLLGPIIPPSMLMIIFGVMAVQPIAPLFIAGIVPGLMMVVAMALVIWFFAMRGKLPEGRGKSLSRSEALKVLTAGLLPGFIPLVVIVGIMAGAMTPTESGAVAALLSLVLGAFYREIHWRDLPKILLAVALNTATITGLIASAAVLSWVLSFEGVPDVLVKGIVSMTQSPVVFLLLCSALLILLGMFLESIAVLIVLVPILMPVVKGLGVDPLQFGVICTVATVMGVVTPPVGPGLYIAMVEAKLPLWSLFRATLPFLFAVLVVLALICLFPAISTWLPSL